MSINTFSELALLIESKTKIFSVCLVIKVYPEGFSEIQKILFPCYCTCANKLFSETNEKAGVFENLEIKSLLLISAFNVSRSEILRTTEVFSGIKSLIFPDVVVDCSQLEANVINNKSIVNFRNHFIDTKIERKSIFSMFIARVC